MRKVKVFHGTSAENAKDILENGFKTNYSNWVCSEPNTIYVWNYDKFVEGETCEVDDFSEIKRYAFGSAQIIAALQNSNSPFISVLEFEIDEDLLEDDTSCEGMSYASSTLVYNVNKLMQIKEINIIEHKFEYQPMFRIFYLAGLITQELSNLCDYFSEKEIELIKMVSKADYWFDELDEMHEYGE
jgi:hypothetical protein